MALFVDYKAYSNKAPDFDAIKLILVSGKEFSQREFLNCGSYTFLDSKMERYFLIPCGKNHLYLFKEGNFHTHPTYVFSFKRILETIKEMSIEENWEESNSYTDIFSVLYGLETLPVLIPALVRIVDEDRKSEKAALLLSESSMAYQFGVHEMKTLIDITTENRNDFLNNSKYIVVYSFPAIFISRDEPFDSFHYEIAVEEDSMVYVSRLDPWQPTEGAKFRKKELMSVDLALYKIITNFNGNSSYKAIDQEKLMNVLRTMLVLKFKS